MILGKVVGLRLVEEEDLPLLAAWRNDPQTWTMFLTPHLISASGQKAADEALSRDPTRLQFMIVRLADDAVVGTIGLSHIDHRNQSAEGAMGMMAPEVRGQELFLDAGRALARYAFMDLNLHRVCGSVYAFNEASLRWIAKFGLKQEGIARKAAFVNGDFHDVILVAVLREEWLEEQGSAGSDVPSSLASR